MQASFEMILSGYDEKINALKKTNVSKTQASLVELVAVLPAIFV